jgi:alkylglycerol monooxygenase
MAQMETTAYYAFGVPLYAAIVAGEYFVAKRRKAPTLSFAPSYGNLTAGLGSIAIGLFLGPALILLYEFGWTHLRIVQWPEGSPWPFFLAIVLADFAHYSHHRLDHRVAACWAVHGVHHQPEEMNFTAAMRHAWFSDLYSWPFYIPLPLFGVHISHFFVATTLLSMHALATHTEQLRFPSFGIFVTPRSHTLHHATNPQYLDKNFGAMLCIWDKLFGTHVEFDPADPPRYGTLRGYATHDGALAQWVLWRDLLDIARRTPTFREKIRVFFQRPGWTPATVVAPPLEVPPNNESISPRTKLYVTIQLAVVTAFSLWIFLLREQHSWTLLFVGMTYILWGIAALGGLLDGRKHAWLVEGFRNVVGLSLFALWLAFERHP